MFRKARKQKEPEETQVIDIGLLEEHLDCIKVRLLEIRGFRKKKIIKTPTFHFMQAIDIEEAWPSAQKSLRQAYELLCRVAGSFQVEHEIMPPTTSFGRALDQFVNLIDRITLFLEENGVSDLSSSKLEALDDAILRVQQSVNLLQRQVMVDFVFTREPN